VKVGEKDKTRMRTFDARFCFKDTARQKRGLYALFVVSKPYDNLSVCPVRRKTHKAMPSMTIFSTKMPSSTCTDGKNPPQHVETFERANPVEIE
jgi:hypothetical protein